LCDADVATVAARLGAELALEVGRKAEDEGGDAVEGSAGSDRAEVAAAEVVERRRWREIGIGAALEGETHVRTRNGHVRRRFKGFVRAIGFCLFSFTYFPSLSPLYLYLLKPLSLLFHLQMEPSRPYIILHSNHNTVSTRHSFVLFFSPLLLLLLIIYITPGILHFLHPPNNYTS